VMVVGLTYTWSVVSVSLPSVNTHLGLGLDECRCFGWIHVRDAPSRRLLYSLVFSISVHCQQSHYPAEVLTSDSCGDLRGADGGGA
jgi:hypothetical protein